MQDRLEACRSHRECFWSASIPLPTRLVDLGLNDDQLCLHETRGETGDYIALSYCWGESSILLKTTRANLDAFRNHIPWSEIPKTLQDAISTVRRLGLRLIWIDCLCILQDSQADWEFEASRMGQYYHNALLTLAASAAVNASSGLFNVRRKISPIEQFQFCGSDGVYHSYVAQTRDTKLQPTLIDDLGVLSDRGWTFQEHALSQRIVHFTESELIWECRTEMVSEDGHPIRDNCHSMIQEFQEKVHEDPVSSWRFLIRAYSSRRLTYTKDKLPAIAGLADRFQQQTGYQYLAGVWKETLPIDLIWSSWGWEEADRPPRILEGPSWSWTSIDGGIAFIMETITPGVPVNVHAKVNDVHCNVLGRNPLGEVTKGTLNVTGPLFKVTIQYNRELNEFGVPTFRLSCDGHRNLIFFPDSSLMQTSFKDPAGERTTTVCRTSAVPEPFQADVWCLWIIATHEELSELQMNFGTEPLKLHGLVLARSDLGPDLYSRVGVVGTSDTELRDNAVETRVFLI